VNHLDALNQVASEYLKGSNETEISKELDMPRAKVVKYLEEWRQMASSNEAIHARAKEALAGMDRHYSTLIQRAYEVVDEATLTSNLTAKTTALKLIADIEAKRIEMLHRAGLLDNKEIAEELISMEKKQETIVNILKDVSLSCDRCKPKIMSRLSSITNEAIIVDD
jgi:DNA-directed RNA polymerase specialized sigma subunit